MALNPWGHGVPLKRGVGFSRKKWSKEAPRREQVKEIIKLGAYINTELAFHLKGDRRNCNGLQSKTQTKVPKEKNGKIGRQNPGKKHA